jgi:hypothetical protein
MSSQWSLAFGPPNQNPVNTSTLPHACHMSSPPHPPWFNHPNNIQWGIQAAKTLLTFYCFINDIMDTYTWMTE